VSAFASWCLLGALIAVFFTFLWLMSGPEQEPFHEADERSWLEDDDADA